MADRTAPTAVEVLHRSIRRHLEGCAQALHGGGSIYQGENDGDTLDNIGTAAQALLEWWVAVHGGADHGSADG